MNDKETTKHAIEKFDTKKWDGMTAQEKQDILWCLNYLLDIAEEHYPKYSGDDQIAEILDIHKEISGEE